MVADSNHLGPVPDDSGNGSRHRMDLVEVMWQTLFTSEKPRE
jgi:hypothetical protein